MSAVAERHSRGGKKDRVRMRICFVCNFTALLCLSWIFVVDFSCFHCGANVLVVSTTTAATHNIYTGFHL